MNRRNFPDRRGFIGAGLILAAGATAPARLLAQSGRLPPTPECAPGRTPAQTEGPYYSSRTPLKTSFRADAQGEPIVLAGKVLSTRCSPIAGAWLDFWHADAQGEYDNSGFRLRGHQFSAADGSYRLETILPALYTGRARHIHVKLRAREGARILTTQVYFPGDTGNTRDSLFRTELVAAGAGERLRMDFVLDA